MLNTIVDTVVWVLIVFGVSMTISKSKLVQPYRTYIQRNFGILKDLVNCPMCLSFWVGIIISLLWTGPTGFSILDGFLAVGSTWILYSIVWNLAVSDDRF